MGRPPGAGAQATRRGDRGTDLTASAAHGPTAATIDLTGVRDPGSAAALEPALGAVLAEMAGRSGQEGVVSRATTPGLHAFGASSPGGRDASRDPRSGGHGGGASIDIAGAEA